MTNKKTSRLFTIGVSLLFCISVLLLFCGVHFGDDRLVLLAMIVGGTGNFLLTSSDDSYCEPRQQKTYDGATRCDNDRNNPL